MARLNTTHTFYQANSFDSFPLEDSSVQLIVTSPPYPMVEMWDEIFAIYNRGIRTSLKKGQGDKAFEKMNKLLDKTWAECYRVLSDGGFALINIGNATRSLNGHFELYSSHSRFLQSFKKIGFDILPYIIWKKPTNSPTKFMGSGVLPAGAYVTLEHEYILVVRKKGKRVFSEPEKRIRRESAIFWEERNAWYSDQWHDILGTKQKLNLSNSRTRSGAFPLDIPMRSILMYSMYGDTVLDPFGGTGTTNMAAMINGRNSIYLDNDASLLNGSQAILKDPTNITAFNTILDQRIEAHATYCQSKEEHFFKYRNSFHNFPVKTNQEKLLKIKKLKTIKAQKNKIKVTLG